MRAGKSPRDSEIVRLADRFQRLMAELYEAAQGDPEIAKAKAADLDGEMTALANRLVSLTPVVNIEFWVMVKLALGAHIDAQQVRDRQGVPAGPLDGFCRAMLERIDAGFFESMVEATAMETGLASRAKH
jgi:hypothetical protein